jgi:hypothetical protein
MRAYFAGVCAGGIAGGAGRGAMPVVAGGLSSLRAVRLPSLLVNTSASTTMMNTAAAIHPHGVGAPILRSASMRSKSLGSVMATSELSRTIWSSSPVLKSAHDNPQQDALFRCVEP